MSAVREESGQWKQTFLKVKGHRLAHALFNFLDCYHCLQYLKTVSGDCLLKSDTVEKCNQASIIAMKFIRLSMDTAADVLTRFPDVHVIHYVRDPRGVIHSRNETGLLEFDVVTDAKLLCRKMFCDIRIKQQLLKRNRGRIYTLRYEDLADDILGTTTSLYNYFGQRVPPELAKGLRADVSAEKDDGQFMPLRKNSSKTAHAWRQELDAGIIRKIDEVCKDVYDILGYAIM
jgi:hypothetical protein